MHSQPPISSKWRKAGYIRPSIVHPLTRHNPGDSSGRGVPNYELRYEKDLPYCEIIVSAKGCGAELPNVAKILTPATLGKNYKGLKQLVLDTICGSNGFMGARGYPCPPFSIGIGLGGQMDVAAKLSREAISTRNWLDHNPDPLFDELEQELLADINKLQNGPAGIGGDTTALDSVMQKIVRMIDWPVLFKILRRRNRHKNHPSSRQHDAVGELCLCTQTDNVRLALQKTGYIRR